jgi:hypothetical protein
MKVGYFLLVLVAFAMIVPDIADEAEAVHMSEECVNACKNGQTAFVQWCVTQGPSNPCHKFDNNNGPHQTFDKNTCIPYCIISPPQNA